MPQNNGAAHLIEGQANRGCATAEPPIDLVRLARNCMGDAALETELLALFSLQAVKIAGDLSGKPVMSAEAVGRIGHTICGSALAVGAGRVAEAALRFEEAGAGSSPAEGTQLAQAAAALEAALGEAVAEIKRIIGGS